MAKTHTPNVTVEHTINRSGESVKKIRPVSKAAATPKLGRADARGWLLCLRDEVLVVAKGAGNRAYVGRVGYVDEFAKPEDRFAEELLVYVQLVATPTKEAQRVMLACTDVQWQNAPIPEEPSAAGDRVRVVPKPATYTDSDRAFDGKLGTVERFESNDPFPALVMVKFDDAALGSTLIQITELVREAKADAPSGPLVVETDSTADDKQWRDGVGHDHAPAPVATTPAEIRPIALADIVVTRNTRKVFDEDALQGLAESIKAQGLISPVTVRPYAAEPGKFELVAGERRFRASKLAEQESIMSIIRHLSDREFLELQLLENLQRVDVRASDEAEAFAELLKNGFSSEEISQRVGKPVKFVLQRAKLAALMPFWLDALEEGRLPIVAANEIARLPDESQVQLENLAMRDYQLKQAGAVFTAHWVKGSISQHILRELNAAAFPKADATLCPAAGACTTCPKRSGAFKQLFDEEELKHDYCLDGPCFEGKKEAFIGRRKKELSKEAGKPVTLLSSSGWNMPAGAISSYSWTEVKPDKPGAVQALVVDGPQAGQTKWVSLPTEKDKTVEKKAERSAEIREGKIAEQHRQLLAGHLYQQALATERAVEAHLDNLLYGELRSQGGPHTPLRLALVTHFNWEMPEGGEPALRKLTPASNFEGLKTWQKENVDRMSYHQKLALYFALLGYNCSTFDSSNERLMGYARAAGADTKALKQQAAGLVDAGKKEKGAAK